mmetsp:Transcript_3895/g.6617  ORF Transcript_3895/g.6617 Transcript_3895/m.6617 type:complete len:93 (-) Transcript_3895:15-293(-)
MEQEQQPRPSNFPQDYLEQFEHLALRWDTSNLASTVEILDAEIGDNLIARSTSSISSFKSVYADRPLELGGRYYFEVKFLQGSNFKLGIYID